MNCYVLGDICTPEGINSINTRISLQQIRALKVTKVAFEWARTYSFIIRIRFFLCRCSLSNFLKHFKIPLYMKYIISLFQNLVRNEAYAFGRCVKFDTSTRCRLIIFAWMQKEKKKRNQQRIVNVQTEFSFDSHWILMCDKMKQT